MFSTTSTSEERLYNWRSFRHNFPESGDEKLVVESFADTKILNRYLDYYTPKSWPNVFEIVHQGYLCQSGLTLIIAASLDYLGFINANEIQLDVISNYITGREGLVLKLENKYYNFSPGEIVTPEFVKDNGTIFESHIITVDKLYT